MQEIHPQANRSKNKEYYFDDVAFGSDNNTLYESTVKPLIGQAMDGYNATMGTESQPGIIPRAVGEIFSYIQKTVNNEFLLRVSYLEIYNETIRDLLAPETTNINIHETKQRGIYVAPLTEEVVTCSQDVLNIIQRGEGNRHISTTDYNLHSSRSHTIFQMVIESRQRSNNDTRSFVSQHPKTLVHPKDQKTSVKISQLNLIDLAGSEKAASNQERRKEGAFINKSLLTLGTVISKLTETGKSVGHIPYRDSKLTRILQPSLSGHAKVVVICTISPYILAVDESINTLKFATRVKKIVLSAKNNAVMDDKALLQQYRGEIMDLKSKLETANQVLLKEKESNKSMITAERKQYEEELSQMRLVRKTLKERIDHLTNLILTSGSVTVSSPPVIYLDTTHEPIHPLKTSSIGTNNPWVLVRDLRQQIQQQQKQFQEQIQQLEQQNKQLQQQEQDQQQWGDYMLDKVATLEAKISLLKPEMEITSVWSDDDDDSMTICWDNQSL
ncbi:P-loop containing nucleoside triphosphate hydrolase protein [Chlamydoabsidia padenii]|nr:P-loop containing nucleoside triphosphate hydrolase protein [Chlamydoabsidia padenii]